MKKALSLIIITVLSFSLMGCSSGSTDTEDSIGLVLPESNYKIYASPELQIQYPINWNVLSKSDVNSKFKENIEVAFISNFKDLFFTPVITIEKVKVAASTSSESLADSIVARNSNSLIDYALLERQNVSTLVGGQTVLTSIVKFKGKEKLSDDTLEYLQMFLVAGETGYIATGAYDPTDNKAEVEKMIDSLRTFRLK